MVAYAAIFIWPLVAIVIFRTRPPIEALLWTVIGAYLLLPVKTGINLPLLPPINKAVIGSGSAALLMILILRQQVRRTGSHPPQLLNPVYVLPGWLPRSRSIRILLAMLFVSILMTVLTNGDRLQYGPRVLPPLRLYDALSTMMLTAMGLLPLILGRKFLGHPDVHKTLLKVLCIAAVAYSALALYEVRFSPQLNRMIYGFTSQSWLMNARGGSWRPTVFLGHGLVVSIFFAMATMATIGYMRVVEKKYMLIMAGVSVWLVMTVFAINSLGGIIIVVVLLPVMLLFGVRLQMLAAASIAAVVLLYPMLRSADVVPVQRIVEFAKTIDQQRAGSLAYRFKNEDLLLDHAMARPIFGWGGWARSRVFNNQGQDIGVTDGLWVIHMGVGGWVGYLCAFGLLTWPVLLLTFRNRGDPVTLATSVVCLVMAANLIDMLPNSSMSPLTSLLAGALIGRLEFSRATSDNVVPQPPPVGVQHNRYSRRPAHQNPARQNNYARRVPAGPDKPPHV